MSRFFKSLWAQLSISIFLLLTLAIALVSVLGARFINRAFERYISRQAELFNDYIVSDLSARYDGAAQGWSLDVLHTIGMYSLYNGFILKVYDADGHLRWDAENHDMSLCGQIMDDISERMTRAQKPGEFSSHSFDLQQGDQRVGAVTIRYYDPYFFNENDFAFISALNSVLLASGLLAAFLSIAAASLLARRIARPIAKTAYIAKQIAKGNYEIRFESQTNTREMNDLVEAVNHLAGALAEQERIRKRLTTDAAHELRTPLTAVGSHLEAMISGLWEVTPDRLVACYEEIKRLGNLVADLQRLTTVEDENFALKMTRVDLRDIVGAATDKMAAEAAKKKLSLSFAPGSAIVEADRERLIQVMTNLLSNAIKYTPEGGHIIAEIFENETEGMIRIIDDGIGIAESEIARIFERFYRTDKSRNRKTGGTGIGLTIANAIAAAHGGRITVESQVDQGSQFTVTLPKIRTPRP